MGIFPSCDFFCLSHSQVGLILVPLCSIPMLIFSGFFVHIQDLASFWQPFAYLSFFRHAFDGAMYTIYGYERKALDCSEDFCLFKSAKKFLKFMKLENVHYEVSVLAIVVAIVIVQILLYCSLRRRVMKVKL
jgi:ABC-2 type transporter